MMFAVKDVSMVRPRALSLRFKFMQNRTNRGFCNDNAIFLCEYNFFMFGKFLDEFLFVNESLLPFLFQLNLYMSTEKK